MDLMAVDFPLDSCNENLPEKDIHRNYARSPGGMPRRVFLLREPRVRPRAAGFSCLQKKQENTEDRATKACNSQRRIWLRNSLVRSCWGWLKKAAGSLTSTIWPSSSSTMRFATWR